jgi:hypothetical protein
MLYIVHCLSIFVTTFRERNQVPKCSVQYISGVMRPHEPLRQWIARSPFELSGWVRNVCKMHVHKRGEVSTMITIHTELKFTSLLSSRLVRYNIVILVDCEHLVVHTMLWLIKLANSALCTDLLYLFLFRLSNLKPLFSLYSHMLSKLRNYGQSFTVVRILSIVYISLLK